MRSKLIILTIFVLIAFLSAHRLNTRAISRQVRFHHHPQYYVVGTGFRKPEKTFASIDRSNQMRPKFVKNSLFFLHGIGRRNIEKRSVHTKRDSNKKDQNFEKRGSQLDALRFLFKNDNMKSRIGPRF